MDGLSSCAGRGANLREDQEGKNAGVGTRDTGAELFKLRISHGASGFRGASAQDRDSGFQSCLHHPLSGTLDLDILQKVDNYSLQLGTVQGFQLAVTSVGMALGGGGGAGATPLLGGPRAGQLRPV